MRENCIVYLILLLSPCIFAAGQWQAEDGCDAAIEIFDESVIDGNGPMVLLDCGNEETISNSLSDFMYFVPLISPTLVDSKTSKENSQLAGVISYERKMKGGSFMSAANFTSKGEVLTKIRLILRR